MMKEYPDYYHYQTEEYQINYRYLSDDGISPVISFQDLVFKITELENKIKELENKIKEKE